LAEFALAADKTLATLPATGLLHEKNGWEMLNYLAVAPVLATLARLVWLFFLRRSGAAPAAA